MINRFFLFYLLLLFSCENHKPIDLDGTSENFQGYLNDYPITSNTIRIKVFKEELEVYKISKKAECYMISYSSNFGNPQVTTDLSYVEYGRQICDKRANLLWTEAVEISQKVPAMIKDINEDEKLDLITFPTYVTIESNINSNTKYSSYEIEDFPNHRKELIILIEKIFDITSR